MNEPISELLDQILNSIRIGNQSDYTFYIKRLDSFRGKVDDETIEGFHNLIQASNAVRLGDSKTGLEYGKKALNLLDHSVLLPPQKLENFLIRTRNIIGLSLSNMGRRDESIKYYEENLEILRNSDNKRDLSVCLNNIGYFHLLKGEYDQSSQYLNEALTIIQTNLYDPDLNDSEVDGALRNTFSENIALIYIHRGEYAKARALLEKILNDCEKNNDLRNKVKILHDIGMIDLEQGKTDQSEEHFLQALELAKSIGYVLRLAMILGDMGDLFLRLGQLEKAQKFINESIAVLEKNGNQEDIVKRWCQLSELNDLLTGDTNQFLYHLNIASRFAIEHSSKEEHLLVQFYLATHYFRQRHFDLSSLIFLAVYLEAKDLTYNFLVINCELYLSAIELSYFIEDGNIKRLKTASSYLASIVDTSKKQGLIFTQIYALFLSAILRMSTLDSEHALEELNIAKKLSIQTENFFALEKIENLIDNYNIIRSISAMNEEVRLPSSLLRTHGLQSFLEEVVFWTSFNTKDTLENFGYLFVVQDESGPNIILSSSDASLYATEAELLKSGITLMVAIGQGEGYYQGLYGPLPINNKTNALIYAKMLKNEQMLDPRAEGKSYSVYLLLMPNETKISIKVHDDLSDLFNKSFSNIDTSGKLSKEWFENLRKNILVNVFKKS